MACLVPSNRKNRKDTLDERFSAVSAELTDLFHQQIAALDDAVFVGMTDEQSKAFEERRERISELTQLLAKFRAAA